MANTQTNSAANGLDLRLHKDPNLDADYFWDLRNDELPFYRALQFTKTFIPIKDGPNNSPTPKGPNKMPSKFEIKKAMERNPDSIQRKSSEKRQQQQQQQPSASFEILTNYQQLVSRKDKIHLRASFVHDLFGSSCPKENMNIWLRMGPRATPKYALLYKLRGITCTCKRGPYDPENVPIIGDVLEQLDAPERNNPRPLLPVGRLDLESEGIILLTNDGTFSRFCTSPAVGLEKVYRVFVKCKGRRKWTHETPTDELCHRLSEITDTITTQPGNDDNYDVPTYPKSNTYPQALESFDFRAASCTIVDVGVAPWHGASTNPDNKRENPQSMCLHALVDIRMQEGAKREVRRLVRAIGFVTHMLVRTAVGGIQWANEAAQDGWEFRVPATVEEASVKCEAYETSRSEAGEAAGTLVLARENALNPRAFRYLRNSEVDGIFSAPATRGA